MSRQAEIAAGENLIRTLDRIAAEYEQEGNPRAERYRSDAQWWRERVAMWRDAQDDHRHEEAA